MLALLRPCVLPTRSLLANRALPSLIKTFTTSSPQHNRILSGIEKQFQQNVKEVKEYDRPWMRPKWMAPENPIYEHITWENVHEYKGIRELPNGDPIGSESSAKGMSPEDAYWFGVQGYQDHVDHYAEAERGWNLNVDGFLRVDERGPHLDIHDPQGRYFFDLPNGGKRYLDP